MLSFPKSYALIPANSALAPAILIDVNIDVFVTIDAMRLVLIGAAAVLLMGDGLQVVGVNARSHAAFMIQLQIIRDFAFVKGVGKTMRSHCSPWDRVKSAIAFLTDRPNPQPATAIWLWLNLGPKPLDSWRSGASIGV